MSPSGFTNEAGPSLVIHTLDIEIFIILILIVLPPLFWNSTSADF